MPNTTARRLASSVRIEETPERRGVLANQRQVATRSTEAPGPEESADLYYRRPPKALVYRHFDGTDSAIRYVRDNLNAAQIAGSVLQVGEYRFEGGQIAEMVKRLGVMPKLDA